jgi:hypothetical protein
MDSPCTKVVSLSLQSFAKCNPLCPLALPTEAYNVAEAKLNTNEGTRNLYSSNYITESLLLSYVDQSFSHYKASGATYTAYPHINKNFCTALGYGLEDRGSRFRFPVEAGNSSFHHRVQNGSGAHTTSYPMGTRGSFPGGGA